MDRALLDFAGLDRAEKPPSIQFWQTRILFDRAT
jgi:hypothetical protein